MVIYLYTEVFGRPYYCYLEYVLVQFDNNKKKNKQMIVMLNLVLIDVICIVSFTVYGSTCVMWDCTYVLWVVEFLICILPVVFEFITPVFVHQMFWWMWTFFIFKRDFAKNMNTTEQNILKQYTHIFITFCLLGCNLSETSWMQPTLARKGM